MVSRTRSILEHLPVEIIFQIVSFLSVKDKYLLSYSSKFFRKTVKEYAQLRDRVFDLQPNMRLDEGLPPHDPYIEKDLYMAISLSSKSLLVLRMNCSLDRDQTTKVLLYACSECIQLTHLSFVDNGAITDSIVEDISENLRNLTQIEVLEPDNPLISGVHHLSETCKKIIFLEISEFLLDLFVQCDEDDDNISITKRRYHIAVENRRCTNLYRSLQDIIFVVWLGYYRLSKFVEELIIEVPQQQHNVVAAVLQLIRDNGILERNNDTRLRVLLKNCNPSTLQNFPPNYVYANGFIEFELRDESFLSFSPSAMEKWNKHMFENLRVLSVNALERPNGTIDDFPIGKQARLFKELSNKAPGFDHIDLQNVFHPFANKRVANLICSRVMKLGIPNIQKLRKLSVSREILDVQFDPLLKLVIKHITQFEILHLHRPRDIIGLNKDVENPYIYLTRIPVMLNYLQKSQFSGMRCVFLDYKYIYMEEQDSCVHLHEYVENARRAIDRFESRYPCIDISTVRNQVLILRESLTKE